MASAKQNAALPEELVLYICRMAGIGGMARFVVRGVDTVSTTIPMSCVTTPSLVRWALEHGCPKDQRFCQVIASGGHLEALSTARSLGCEWSAPTCAKAAFGGHLGVLKWARANGCPWDGHTAFFAAGKRRFEVLEWMSRNGWDLNEPGAMEGGAYGGHIELMMWLRAKGVVWKSTACEYAAYSGRIETVKWLRSSGCPWDERVIFAAAKRGHLTLLKWLASNCDQDWGRCGNLVAFAAATAGRLEVLEWAYSNDMEWHDDLIGGLEGAALKGQMRVMEWLVTRGCRMTTKTSSLAALGGNLDVLKWLHAKGCPINRAKISQVACYLNNPAVREWVETLL
jgi:hypothetical protein